LALGHISETDTVGYRTHVKGNVFLAAGGNLAKKVFFIGIAQALDDPY
jgi:hypothetical protein